ncbi:tRNA pseudouridine(38-40) synthase TruA [Nocardioides yefusunii]|uniref:tRNA pseudouridine synthase A n=1 Tax=Nocardioides yefusunii TaxID=2500546 RepID=A0ABW1R141_9ACTN|nr:tRNA pseudouridine(38-40) synthase TruA [Nocardioides yefusunii]
MRIRIDLAYDGTDFFGWATQPNLRTVQGTLETSLATALRLDSVRVVVAGRTDTGVHGRGQVVHLDVDRATIEGSTGRSTDPPLVALRRRLNGILPADLRIKEIAEAPEGFDARFSAIWRRYTYRVVDRPELVDPLTRRHVLAWRHPLDVDAMNAAAAHLVGLNDFAAFCKKREGATTVRTLKELRWTRTPDGLLEATVVADAFCHNMVRSLVGCMLAVGDGRRPSEWAAQVMTGRVRDPSIVVVAAHGLTLEEVGYPEGAELIAQAERSRAKRVLPPQAHACP